jgi:hypothetical protein
MHGNDLLLGCQQILASFSPVWDDLSSDLSFFSEEDSDVPKSRDGDFLQKCRC